MQSLIVRRSLAALIFSLAMLMCDAQRTGAAEVALGSESPSETQARASVAGSVGDTFARASYSAQSVGTQLRRTESASDTWTSVLIGLGLIAFQLRRTQRLLHHLPLAR